MPAGTPRTWFIIPAAVVLLVVVGVWMARSSPSSSRDHSGREDVRVLIAAPEGGGAGAAKHVIERLVLLGLDGRIVRAEENELELTLRRVAESDALLASVLTPEALSFHLLPEPQRSPDDTSPDALAAAAPVPQDPNAPPLPLPPPGGEDGGAQANGDNPRPWSIGAGRDATREKADPAALEGGERFALECIPPRPKGTPPPCALWRARPFPQLSTRDVTEVKIGAHRQTEEPLVTVTFRPEAREALRALAEASKGQMLAVLAFGELAARPRMKGQLNFIDPEAGQLVFSTRTGDTDRRTAQERALRISTASKLSPLPKLEVRRITPAPGPTAPSP